MVEFRFKYLADDGKIYMEYISAGYLNKALDIFYEKHPGISIIDITPMNI